VLLGTLALALFNASKDEVARNFAYAYALISIGVLVSFGHAFLTALGLTHSRSSQIYGYVLYQRRITMIQKRDPGNFGLSPFCPSFYASSHK